jgi:small subunit ribosomal protein S6
MHQTDTAKGGYNMPLYENVFLVRPDVSASQVEALTKEFSAIIEEGGGSAPKVEHWGLRTLAYRIKKNRKAHYVLMNLDAPADALHEMERNMRIHEDVMRHLTIRMEELEEEPSVIMQSRGSRDDHRREDRGGRGSRNDARPRQQATPTTAAAPPNEEAPGKENAGAAESAESGDKAEAGDQK